VAAVAVVAVRSQQVAEFTTATRFEAHEAIISARATEEEAAHAAQAAAGTKLGVAKAAIAEADASTSTT